MVTLLEGDCRLLLPTLPADSVHCVVTSPPYWGLRDYGVEGQLGLEATPEAYVAAMVGVFREVRRVLRADGTLWLNMGDGYAAGGNGIGSGKQLTNVGSWMPPHRAPEGLKAKDLVGMPWRLAFALQADGWFLRADIIWTKPNPMPESVTDRPTKAHEYVFLLTKSARYYYDADAVRERVGELTRRQKTSRGGCYTNNTAFNNSYDYSGHAPYSDGEPSVEGRNLRSVWSIPSAPFPDAHFATFPPALASRCIQAGTSERGCCRACGAPWVRQVEASGGTIGQSWHDHRNDLGRGQRKTQVMSNGTYRRETTGWAPSCPCPPSAPVPSTVLDPFAGSGTTGQVAEQLGRHSVLIELSPAYVAMARDRTAQCGLFAQ